MTDDYKGPQPLPEEEVKIVQDWNDMQSPSFTPSQNTGKSEEPKAGAAAAEEKAEPKAGVGLNSKEDDKMPSVIEGVKDRIKSINDFFENGFNRIMGKDKEEPAKEQKPNKESEPAKESEPKKEQEPAKEAVAATHESSDHDRIVSMLEEMNKRNGADKAVDANAMADQLIGKFGNDAVAVTEFALMQPKNYGELFDKAIFLSRLVLQDMLELAAKEVEKLVQYIAAEKEKQLENKKEKDGKGDKVTDKPKEEKGDSITDKPKDEKGDGVTDKPKEDEKGSGVTDKPKDEKGDSTVAQQVDEAEAKRQHDLESARKLYDEDPKKFQQAKERYQDLAQHGETQTIKDEAKYYGDIINQVEQESKQAQQSKSKEQEQPANEPKAPEQVDEAEAKRQHDLEAARRLHDEDPKKFQQAKERYQDLAQHGETQTIKDEAKYYGDIINQVEQEHKQAQQSKSQTQEQPANAPQEKPKQIVVSYDQDGSKLYIVSGYGRSDPNNPDRSRIYDGVYKVDGDNVTYHDGTGRGWGARDKDLKKMLKNESKEVQKQMKKDAKAAQKKAEMEAKNARKAEKAAKKEQKNAGKSNGDDMYLTSNKQPQIKTVPLSAMKRTSRTND